MKGREEDYADDVTCCMTAYLSKQYNLMDIVRKTCHGCLMEGLPKVDLLRLHLLSGALHA